MPSTINAKLFLIHLYCKLYPTCLAVNPFKVKYLFTNNYFVFNKKGNFFKLMNNREDLDIKLQKVTLAIAMHEVVEDIYKTDQEKQRIISKLIEFKEAIISKGIELNIELKAV